MSEFRRTSGNQTENPWAERVKTLRIFTEGMDEIFRKYFDAVHRGIPWKGKLLEQLEITTKEEGKEKGEEKKEGPNFTLVRNIYTNTGVSDDYGLHVGENTPTKYVNRFYRIKSGTVHELLPTYEKSIEILYESGLSEFAAGNDTEELHDQPATLEVIEALMKLATAKETKPQPITVIDLIENHTANSIREFGEEEEAWDENEGADTQLAITFFNSSFDEIMEEHAGDIKIQDDNEELSLTLQKGHSETTIDFIRSMDEDTDIDRMIILTHKPENWYRTHMVFQVKEEALQSMYMSDNPADESGTTYAFMDPNAARDLFALIRNQGQNDPNYGILTNEADC